MKGTVRAHCRGNPREKCESADTHVIWKLPKKYDKMTKIRTKTSKDVAVTQASRYIISGCPIIYLKVKKMLRSLGSTAKNYLQSMESFSKENEYVVVSETMQKEVR